MMHYLHQIANYSGHPETAIFFIKLLTSEGKAKEAVEVMLTQQNRGPKIVEKRLDLFDHLVHVKSSKAFVDICLKSCMKSSSHVLTYVLSLRAGL